MTRLFLDWEFKSEVDLKTCGLDVVMRHPSTQALMLGWAFDQDTPTVWQPHVDGELPAEVMRAARTKGIQKVGWNCTVERLGFRHFAATEIPIEQWLDPSVIAAYAGMGRSLEAASVFLGLSDAAKEKHRVKENRGVTLFSKPNKKGRFNDWKTHPEKWSEFVEYCRQDVIAERAVLQRLEGFFALPPMERRVWELDQRINDRGMPVDRVFVDNARRMVTDERERLMKELTALTNLANCNSNPQLLGWLKEQGYPLNSLGAAKVAAVLADATF